MKKVHRNLNTLKKSLVKIQQFWNLNQRVDGIYVNGIDLISWNEENKITEFKVIVRPLQAVNKLHQQMQNMLERMKA